MEKSNFKISTSPNGEEIALDYIDGTGRKQSCVIDKDNIDGVGNPEACQMLRTEISKTKQTLK